jgi:hypothetical protein
MMDAPSRRIGGARWPPGLLSTAQRAASVSMRGTEGNYKRRKQP